MQPDLTEDQEYFTRRAREELVSAVIAEDNRVARIHIDMAETYQKRVRLLDTTEPASTS